MVTTAPAGPDSETRACLGSTRASHLRHTLELGAERGHFSSLTPLITPAHDAPLSLLDPRYRVWLQSGRSAVGGACGCAQKVAWGTAPSSFDHVEPELMLKSLDGCRVSVGKVVGALPSLHPYPVAEKAIVESTCQSLTHPPHLLGAS